MSENRTLFKSNHRRKKSRKAQMEIMGLAIIFVLIIFGILFAVRFILTKPQSDLRQTFIEAQTASNMLSAIKGTTTDCRRMTIGQLLQDCAAGGSISCGAYNSCSYAEKAIGAIINQTLDEWNRDYELSFIGPQRVESIHFLNNGCPGEKESKTDPIPYRGGTMNIKLDIC